MIYSIPEVNYEQLKAKLFKIETKCIKLGCPFSFQEIGEEFVKHQLLDNTVVTLKHFIIDVSGTASMNGWELVAVIEHTPTGNVVYQTSTRVQIPEKYYTADSNCDHCKSHRHRNKTAIVYNQESQQFSQVGTTCLKVYTGALDSEIVAMNLQILKVAEDCSSGALEFCRDFRYYNLKEYLMCAISCINTDGYHKTDSEHPTKLAAFDLYQDFRNDMNLNPSYTQVEIEAEAAIYWIKTTEDCNDYIHNLKVICNSDWVQYNHLGFIASLVSAYRRNKSKMQDGNSTASKVSDYQGTIGDTIEVNIDTATCISSWETQFGYTYLYKFVDEYSNVYIWRTGKSIMCENVKSICGKVKDHQEYQGIKQTVLTRCRI